MASCTPQKAMKNRSVINLDLHTIREGLAKPTLADVTLAEATYTVLAFYRLV